MLSRPWWASMADWFDTIVGVPMNGQVHYFFKKCRWSQQHSQKKKGYAQNRDQAQKCGLYAKTLNLSSHLSHPQRQ